MPIKLALVRFFLSLKLNLGKPIHVRKKKNGSYFRLSTRNLRIETGRYENLLRGIT